MKKKIYFSAIPPEQTQEQIKNFLDKFRSLPQVRQNPLTITQANTFFLPLVYIGAVQDDALKAAIESGQMTAVQSQPVKTSISGISYFYSSKQGLGSTIFLDVADSEKQLKELHKTLSRYLSDAEFSPAKHFTPHIPIATLEKVRREHDRRRILDEVSEIEIQEIDPFFIDKISMIEILYEDTINPKFSVFKEFNLGTSWSNSETEEI